MKKFKKVLICFLCIFILVNCVVADYLKVNVYAVEPVTVGLTKEALEILTVIVVGYGVYVAGQALTDQEVQALSRETVDEILKQQNMYDQTVAQLTPDTLDDVITGACTLNAMSFS